MSRKRKTKIIATLGPASNSQKVIEALYKAGVDTFRLNMSHGDQDDKRELIGNIRAVEEKVGRPIAIMVDLQGPKLRVGMVEGGKVKLKRGQVFTLDLDQTPGDQTRVNFPHPEIYSAIEKGHAVLLNDGRIRLTVEKGGKSAITCKIKIGGDLSHHKGVNLPNSDIPVRSLTPKDKRDLQFALEMGVEWIALSFVQRAVDVREASKLIRGRAGMLAKIEKPAALKELEEILTIADATMVARGDLGVECKVEEVPIIQKNIIHTARSMGKPVVVATQMLESMITAQVPTRAEVSDVANAIFDGADAIMLSAETAVGEYPVEAAKVMDKIAAQIESDPVYRKMLRQEALAGTPSTDDAITAAARQVTRTLHASAIVTFTTSGSTALRAARERPLAQILTLTPNLQVARKLCLVWGLHTVKTRDVKSFEEMTGKAKRMAVRHGLAKVGDKIVITAGVPFGTPGSTNVLHIVEIKSSDLTGKSVETFL
jgi:pyruvate kinase